MLMAQNRNKNIFLGGKTTDMPERKKVENIIVHGLKCKLKMLIFCLQFAFNLTDRYIFGLNFPPDQIPGPLSTAPSGAPDF